MRNRPSKEVGAVGNGVELGPVLSNLQGDKENYHQKHTEELSQPFFSWLH